MVELVQQGLRVDLQKYGCAKDDGEDGLLFWIYNRHVLFDLFC